MTPRTAVLDGLGVAVPDRVVTNDDLAARLDTTDEWIRTRTGIAERRIADPAVATSDLAYEAAQATLKDADDVPPAAVIVATTTPDHPMPGVAPLVAARLGWDSVPAFDVQAACSGFVYGLASAAGLIAAGVTDRVLLIGADLMSRITNQDDRATAVLFGDGAGAVMLRAGSPDEPGAVGPFDLGSDGAHVDRLIVAAGGTRVPSHPTEPARYLSMDGRDVYRHAVRRMTESCRALLDRAGLGVDDVDRFVAHQANLRILMAVADRLGVAEERRVSNVDLYGNTSAASIPLALADAALRPGERILLTAFGSGFTWGSTLMTWPDLGP
ncbi:MAG TPA: beta-ketoacyl-ACP synthase III [Euzebyales bacterium]|nr:beta-ketoacyl-ACP synthase III [Euzebyales bacterium]